MLRLRQLKPGTRFWILFSAGSVMLAVPAFLRPDLLPALFIFLLFSLPAIGYVLDNYYNAQVKTLQDVETRIQGSFQKFEDREKHYQNDVGQLQAELAKLQQLNINLQEAGSVQQILHSLAEAAHYIVDFDRTLIFLYNPESDMLECREAKSAEPEFLHDFILPVSAEGGVPAKAFQEQTLYQVKDFSEIPPNYYPAPPYDRVFALHPQSMLIVPLVVNKKGLGILMVDNSSEQEQITSQHIELLKLFAYQASLAIATIRMQDELQQLNLELEHNFQDLLERRNFYSTIAQDLSSAMAQMSFSIAQVTESAHNLTRQSEHLLGQGDELIKQVSKVDDIIASINTVTRQTKLLAFNATIEAVRVGEAGRGFAVVAEEVRKLAQRSRDDSTMIKSTLKNMQQAITAVAEVADATHHIALSQQQGTEQMNVVTKDVLKRTEDLVDSLQI